MADASRPNVLFIYCDELRADALGAYATGAFRPRTPRLDGLAERGVVFEQTFCNSPLCVPSRTCLLSGAYCEQTGVYANEGVWPGFALPRPLTTWPVAMAEAGYATANFGKTHVHRDLACWSHHDAKGSGMKNLTDVVARTDPSVITPRGTPTLIGGRFPEGRDYPPEQVTERALAWLAQQDGPFLCRASYLQPHTPVYPPPAFIEQLMSDPALDGAWIDTPEASRYEQRFAEVIDADNLTPEQVRLARVYYHALTAWVDVQVGRLLDGLEELGLRDSTVIAFEADHGAALGEGRRFAKHVFAPEVHRVPRIIAGPGLPEGQRRGDINESIDLGPTLLSLCGVEPGAQLASQMRGRDLFRDDPPPGVFSTIGHGETASFAFPNLQSGRWYADRGWPRRACVRTDRYRLDRTERIDGRPAAADERDVFLCDWRADPDERHNLAADPAAAEALAQLNRMLDEHTAHAVEPDHVPTR